MGKCLTLLTLNAALLCLAPRGILAQQPGSNTADLLSGSWLIAEPSVGPETRFSRWKLQFERDGSISGANPDGLRYRRPGWIPGQHRGEDFEARVESVEAEGRSLGRVAA